MTEKKEENKTRKEGMGIHLIKLDIDGTITGFDGVDDFETLNPKVERVIRLLSKDGHIVCLSTGRNFHAALPIYKQAGLSTYLSTYNGAYITNPSHSNSAVTMTFISNKIVKDILNENIIRKNLLNVLIDRDDLQILATGDDAHYKKVFFRGNPYLKNSYSQTLDLLGERNALQVILEFPNEIVLINSVFAVLRKYRNAIGFYVEKKLKAEKVGDKILVPDSRYTTIRIHNRYASKGKGAEIIGSYYNISLENTLAFGNEVNDIEIFRTVGKGIVTAGTDCAHYLRTLAYDVTSHEHKINSDGVAEFLINYFGYKV